MTDDDRLDVAVEGMLVSLRRVLEGPDYALPFYGTSVDRVVAQVRDCVRQARATGRRETPTWEITPADVLALELWGGRHGEL